MGRKSDAAAIIICLTTLSIITYGPAFNYFNNPEKDAKAWLNIGINLYAHEKYKEARQAFDKVDPESSKYSDAQKHKTSIQNFLSEKNIRKNVKAGVAEEASRDIAITEKIRKSIEANKILYAILNGTPVKYDSITVKGDLNLRQLGLQKIITSTIIITNSEFEGVVTFSNITFEKSINLANSNFAKNADFSGSNFGEYVEIGRAKFAKNADFSGANFTEDVYFSGSNFTEDVYFSGSNFAKNAYFSGANFAKNAYFSGANFGGYSCFNNVIFDGSKTNFLDTKFRERVAFNDATFKAEFEGWDKIKHALIFDEKTYSELYNNFKEYSRFDDMDDCHYQHRCEKMSRSKGFGVFKDMISCVILGYGVKWQNTIVFAVIILFIFGLRFSTDIKSGNIKSDLKQGLCISAMILLLLPLELRSSKRDFYMEFIDDHIFYAIVERFAGWSLFLILIGIFSRIMIRY